MSAVEPARRQPASPATEPCSLPQLLGYFLRLGAFGFGGPIALCGYMQRDLVEQRGWIAPEDYKHGLALAQLAPGPLAAQLAIYLGWTKGGIPGRSVRSFGSHLLRCVPENRVVRGLGDLPGCKAALGGDGTLPRQQLEV